MSKIRVLVADDETLFREGVCAILKLCDDIQIVGEATNAKETIEMVRKQVPDIVVMNLATPLVESVRVTDLLHKENKDTKVLLLIQDESREWVLSGLRTEANGYISKCATAKELIAAITRVYHGDYFLHPLIAKKIIEDYSSLSKRSEGPSRLPD
jgi:DNA-binding NarL/FixJ family response regulator